MPFELLSAPAAQWRQRGLTYLLMPEGFDLQAYIHPQAAQTATKPAPGQTKAPRELSPRQAPSPGRHEQPQPPPTAPAPKSKNGQGLSLQDWPAPWRELLHRTHPGKVLWTYTHLGEDLLVAETEGRDRRRAFLARLLRDLAHPTGTHTFWPISLPQDAAGNGGPPAPGIFWEAVAHLGARGVMIMGAPAIEALALPVPLVPLQQIRYKKYLLWGLEDMEDILSSEQKYASMLAFIRTALPLVMR